MKNLVLLRHAKSSWKDPHLSDHDRPLNKRGKHDAPEMAKKYLGFFLSPQYVICSTSRRTKDTLSVFEKELGITPEQIAYERDLYLADAVSLQHEISLTEKSVDTLLVVGHNPGLTVLANILVPGITENIPTCAIIGFRINSDSWAGIFNNQEITCTGFITPKSF